MTTIKTIKIQFSKDIYILEVKEGTFGNKFYSLFINGMFQKNYKRLSKDLKDFFKL
jgi:hypothetical protein